MNKATAVRQFRDLWNDLIEESPQWKNDTIAKCEAWGNYTDALCKDGDITLRQYENWTNPF